MFCLLSLEKYLIAGEFNHQQTESLFLEKELKNKINLPKYKVCFWQALFFISPYGLVNALEFSNFSMGTWLWLHGAWLFPIFFMHLYLEYNYKWYVLLWHFALSWIISPDVFWACMPALCFVTAAYFPFFRKWWKLELLCQLLTSRIRFYIYSKRMMWLWLVEKLDAGKQHRYLVVQFYKKMLSQFCRYSVIAICPIQWVVSPAFYMSIIDTIVFTLASSIFCLSFEEVWSVCVCIYILWKKNPEILFMSW